MIQNIDKRIQQQKGVFSIIFIWILSLFFVNISGEFTLIDDWAYSKSVRDLSEFGVFKIYDRIAITFVSNLLWGSLFTKVFGFSFFVLRLSTVIAGGVLIYTFYRWLGLITENRKLQLFCTALLAFNPLFYVLSTTFMTDIFFLMNACISLYFFTAHLKTENLRLLFWAFFFTIVAVLSRQVGMVIPLSFLLISLKKTIPLKHRMYTYVGVLSTLCCLLFYYLFLSVNNSTPSHYTLHSNELIHQLSGINKQIIFRWLFYFYTTVVSISILLLPVGLYLLGQIKVNSKNILLMFLSFLLIIGIIGVFRDTTFPFNGQIINDYGIGGYFFSTPQYRIDQLSFDLPDWLITIVISLSLSVFSYLILAQLKTARDTYKNSRLIQFLTLAIIIYYPCFGFVFVFDRYLLFHIMMIIPLLIMIFHTSIGNVSRNFFGVGVLLIFSALTIIGTRDYFEYNRIKTKALNNLTEKQHILPKHIDGGMEFNAWNGYKGDFFKSNVGKEWWCVEEDKYLISIDKEVAGFTIYKEYAYSSWLGLKKRKLMVLRKNP
ncbi:glycosyltransferase family 39 protein [Crocinitomicaceae bacterium]|jgi:hypothetical protein|nr:glycosyltransferase family 39 protein [Crocinitomicaceae bacterium]MDC0272468.1 glycosyltransferase family 39 protein [Crocinitomicaceae bacterium]MDC0459895.1 glycosyltransferase family 39 protein [Crocinitomicaceae bacterium]